MGLNDGQELNWIKSILGQLNVGGILRVKCEIIYHIINSPTARAEATVLSASSGQNMLEDIVLMINLHVGNTKSMFFSASLPPSDLESKISTNYIIAMN